MRITDNLTKANFQLRSTLSYTWVNGHQMKFHGNKKYPSKTKLFLFNQRVNDIRTIGKEILKDIFRRQKKSK